jgi:ATP-dependent DNA helicase RecQ
MESTHDLLKKHWGYSCFLPHQQEIITSILEGRDTLAVMATGGGKSLCYQLPALCLGGLTLVISPLISLMKDQVDDLNFRGIPAAAYNSSLEYRDRTRIESELKDGSLRLLFISPEKCMQAHFLEFGSHTLNHQMLTKLTSQQAWQEMTDSKKILEKD